jgi:hypothetical protein
MKLFKSRVIEKRSSHFELGNKTVTINNTGDWSIYSTNKYSNVLFELPAREVSDFIRLLRYAESQSKKK